MTNNPYLERLAKIGIKPHNENEPLYKYATVSTFKTILESNTLRFGNPAYYNDPFEFSDDCFDFEIEDETFRTLLKHNLSFAPEEEQRKLEHLISTFPKQTFIDVHKKRIEAYKQTALVFCTSISPLIPLMWSHYSKNHKGICFGIKMPLDFNNSKEMVVTKSVAYLPSIIKNSILTDDQALIMDAVYNWIYTKSKDWEYEKEMRTYRLRKHPIIYDKDYILPEPIEYEDIPFEKHTLTEVHYGIHTSQKDIEEVEERLNKYGYNNVLNRYQMRKISNTYEIERIKI